MNYSKLSVKDLEELRDHITEYYETYYSEIRSRLASQDPVAYASVPEHFKGYRRIVTQLGRDGVVITHWSSGSDSFDFHISPEQTVKELLAEQCGGEEILDYQPGEDFGTYEISEPLRLVVDDRVVWMSGWTRLDISSGIDAWESLERAREAAREDLAQYTIT